MPDSDKVKPTLKGLSVLAAGFALHLVIGSLYLWGSIGVYVASYYRFRPNGTESSKIRLATTGSIFPAQNVCLNIGMILGLGLAQKFGFRKFSLGVSALMVGAIWASALITNFYLFFLLYAGVFGFLSGLLFMLPLYLGWNYFPSRRGMVSGIILAGFGLSSFLFNLIAVNQVNPRFDRPDYKIEEGHDIDWYFRNPAITTNVPRMLRTLSYVYAAIAILASLFLNEEFARYPILSLESPSKRRDSLLEAAGRPHLEISLLTDEDDGRASSLSNECPNIGTALLSKYFYQLCIMLGGSTLFGLFVWGEYKNLGYNLGHRTSLLTAAFSFGSIVNAVARAFSGILVDVMGFRRLFLILCGIQIALILLMILISKSAVGYFILVILGMGIEGSFFGIFPAICSRVFGNKVASSIYGFVFIGYTLSNILQFALANHILNNVPEYVMFLAFLAYTAIAMVICWLFDENKIQWYKPYQTPKTIEM